MAAIAGKGGSILMRSFRYTPMTVHLIRRYARGRRCAATIAGLLNCLPSTVETICRKHDIELPPVDGASPAPAIHRDPFLNPARRTARPGLTTVSIPIANEALTIIEREARRRNTTAPVLIARLSELVAQDKIFDAMLDL